MDEKRSLQRFNLRFPTRIEVVNKNNRNSEPQVLNLMTRDMSSAGAFFHTKAPLPDGTEVKLDLFLSLTKQKWSESTQSLLKLEGRVVRSDTEGMAVRFRRNYKIFPLNNG